MTYRELAVRIINLPEKYQDEAVTVLRDDLQGIFPLFGPMVRPSNTPNSVQSNIIFTIGVGAMTYDRK